ncbi:MAG: MFS transporter [Anaerolineae bacterium]
MQDTTTLTRAQYTRNIIALVADSMLFYMAMSFVGANTVLPALLGMLTDSELVIGIGSGITRGAWLLPQLLVAGFITRMRRRRKLIVGAAWLSRPLMLVIALTIWRAAVPSPTLTIVVLLAVFFIFFSLDAVVSVPWFDHLARTISARRRGIVVGTGQILGGFGGIGAGAAVRYLLSAESPWSFPDNYALVYVAASGLLLLSSIAISFIADPDCTPADGTSAPTPRENLRLLPTFLRDDRPFRRLIVVQLLLGFVGVATAFYVLYAQRVLGFTLGDTGLFVSMQVGGSMIAGVLLGYIQNRLGPLAHIRLQILLAVVAPLLALLAGAVSGLGGELTHWIYAALFLMLGVYIGGGAWPFNNWIMEYAAETRRPMYIGIANTLSALTMLAPVLGGLVVDRISYPAVFILALAFCALALGVSAGLPSTRAASPVDTEA